jgi:hypothetical protein
MRLIRGVVFKLIVQLFLNAQDFLLKTFEKLFIVLSINSIPLLLVFLDERLVNFELIRTESLDYCDYGQV